MNDFFRHQLLVTIFMTFALVQAGCSSNHPPAPFTLNSLETINSNFDLEGMKEELATMAIGSPEAIELGARFTKEAFEKSGYSLDKTVFKYVKEATPAHTQMHIFVTRAGGLYILAASQGEEYENALIRSGAYSQKTIDFIKNNN